MKFEADVTVTDRCIQDYSMSDPLYRDVSSLLGESLWQQLINKLVINETFDKDTGAYIYKVSIQVKDLNDEE